MKFRTEIDIIPSSRPLDPQRSVVLLGSCFTDSIGEKMRWCRWRAMPNICGVLYNPASIARILHLACSLRGDCADEIRDSIVEKDSLWMSWLMDSGVASCSETSTERNVMERIRKLGDAVAEAGALIVTFGTSWIYELSSNEGYVVSNCHKFPATEFLRRRLGVDEIVSQWHQLIADIRTLNPEIRIIFTVSPIRHLKDGFEGNSRSKATLLLACERLCEECGNVEYFPAFELLNDDLRDYRFYASDLVHPSADAVEYIWEKFCDRYLSKEGRAMLAEGERITKALNHRPIIRDDAGGYGSTESTFKIKAKMKYDAFISRYPGTLREDE